MSGKSERHHRFDDEKLTHLKKIREESVGYPYCSPGIGVCPGEDRIYLANLEKIPKVYFEGESPKNVIMAAVDAKRDFLQEEGIA